MSHFDRGFVVPAWALYYPGVWRAVWANARGPGSIVSMIREGDPEGRAYSVLSDSLRPRDPNRAGGGDRPQE